METVRISFGRYGSFIFSISNVIQLIGWTAIMIVSGAVAAYYLVPIFGQTAWCFIVGILIVAWVALDLKQVSRIQSITVVLLFGLTAVMGCVIFGDSPQGAPPLSSELSFGGAVELAVAMPLSWLPVVSDYTRRARRPLASTLASTLAYFFGSCWMFVIGLGAAIFAGSNDIAVILGAAGLGAVGILVVVFSTVTTTFLDAASAGISAQNMMPRLDAKKAGIAAAVIGSLLAAFAPVMHFEGFLYFIGSIFAPMAAILIVDFFIFKNDASEKAFNAPNIVLWALGFVLYRISMSWDIVVGNTLPVLFIIAGLACFLQLALRKIKGPQLPKTSKVKE